MLGLGPIGGPIAALASVVVLSLTPDEGLKTAGTVVAIRCLNVDAAATVLFGASSATSVSVSGDTVTCTTPAGDSVYMDDVTVTNSTTDANTKQNAFDRLSPGTQIASASAALQALTEYEIDYPGSLPWSGTASAGSSGSRSLTASGFDPTTGSTHNSHAAVAFDGSQYLIGPANDAIFGTSLTFFCLFRADDMPVSAGASYTDGNLLTDGANAETTFGINSDGLVGCVIDNTVTYQKVVSPCKQGVWVLAQWRVDAAGNVLESRVNRQRVWDSVVCNGGWTSGTPSTTLFGRSYGAIFFKGEVLARGCCDSALSTASLDAIGSYFQTLFDLPELRFVDLAPISLDPSACVMTGLWDNYAGSSPWAGTASAGSSGSNDLVNGSFVAPSAGTALNGIGTASFNGTTNAMQTTDSTGTMLGPESLAQPGGIYGGGYTVGATMGWTVYHLVKFNSLPTSAGVGYLDAVLLSGLQAVQGVGVSSDRGAQGFAIDESDDTLSNYVNTPGIKPNTNVKTIPTIGDYGLIQTRWTGMGATLECRLIDTKVGEWQKVMCRPPMYPSSPDVLRVSVAYDNIAGYVDGEIATIGIIARTLSSHSLDGMALWIQNQYALDFDFSTGNNYTMAADGASFALTGNNVNYKVSMPVATGSFLETGQNATLKAARKISTVVGAFNETGQNAGLTAQRKITTVVGAFVLTGQNAGLTAQRKLSTIVGTYALAGQNAGLNAGRKLSVTAGSYLETGQNISTAITRKLITTTGAFVFTGQNAGITAQRKLVVGTGSFLETGQNANFTVARKLIAGTGAFLETGQDVIFKISMPVGTGAFNETGQNATLTTQRKLVTVAGSFAETGQNATLTKQSKLSADPGSFALTGQDAALRFNRLFHVSTGAFTFTGQDATLAAGRRFSVDVGAFTLAANDINFARGKGIAPDGGVFVFSGQNATLAKISHLSVSAGVFAFTGQDAIVSHGYLLAAAVGSFTSIGQNAGLIAARKMSANTGAFTLVGVNADLTRQLIFPVGTGSFVTAGHNATLRIVRSITADTGTFAVLGVDVGLMSNVALGISADSGSFLCTGGTVEFKTVFKHTIASEARLRTSIALEHHPANTITLSARPRGTKITLSDETRTTITLTNEPRTRITLIMSTSDFYDVGDDAEITGVIRRRLTGALIDPTTLVVRVLKPDGTIITMTFDDGVEETRLVRDEGDEERELGLTPEGVFIATIDCDLAGTYVVEWRTTGEGKAAEPTTFTVRAPRIPA